MKKQLPKKGCGPVKKSCSCLPPEPTKGGGGALTKIQTHPQTHYEHTIACLGARWRISQTLKIVIKPALHLPGCLLVSPWVSSGCIPDTRCLPGVSRCLPYACRCLQIFIIAPKGLPTVVWWNNRGYYQIWPLAKKIFFLDYTAFGRVCYGAKYSHRVWEPFAHTFEK